MYFFHEVESALTGDADNDTRSITLDIDPPVRRLGDKLLHHLLRLEGLDRAVVVGGLLHLLPGEIMGWLDSAVAYKRYSKNPRRILRKDEELAGLRSSGTHHHVP